MGERVEQEEIFSQVLRAGRRTYFFDVRATKADDYYLTVTESKKFTHDDGSFHYQNSPHPSLVFLSVFLVLQCLSSYRKELCIRFLFL